MTDFYDQLAPFYHIIYGDWNSAFSAKRNCEATEQQATQLSSIIQKHWSQQVQTILDVSCGIGTQAIGLAVQGYIVTASDLSSQAIDRAQQEAQHRNLAIRFSVCDMRTVYTHHGIDAPIDVKCFLCSKNASHQALRKLSTFCE